MRLIGILLVLLVFQGVSGCLDNNTPASGATLQNSYQAGPPSSPPASTGPPTSGPSSPLPNATLPNLRFEGCRGGFPTLYVPDALTASHIPAAFEPQGLVPGTTLLNLDILKCPRVTLPHAVRENVSLLWSYAGVNPHNASWSNQSLDFYAFDLLVNDPEVVAALRGSGANAELATFNEEVTPIADQIAVAKWTFSNARVMYKITYHYPLQAQTSETEYKKNYWYGTDPYYRVAVKQVYRLYGLESNAAGILELSGDSAFVQFLGASPVAVGVEVFEGLRYDIPATPTVFRTNNA